MNPLPLNIDRSAFRRGEYVGYCVGAQRIHKTSEGWQTYSLGSSQGQFVPAFGRTLAELGANLASEQKRLNPFGL